MRQHITFSGLSTSPTDHEAHEGDCATLTHLIAEDGALRPIGITTETFCAVNSGATVIGIHRTPDYTHLITEEEYNTGGWRYVWTDGSSTHTLATLDQKAHAAMAFGVVQHAVVTRAVAKGEQGYAPDFARDGK